MISDILLTPNLVSLSIYPTRLQSMMPKSFYHLNKFVQKPFALVMRGKRFYRLYRILIVSASQWAS